MLPLVASKQKFDLAKLDVLSICLCDQRQNYLDIEVLLLSLQFYLQHSIMTKTPEMWYELVLQGKLQWQNVYVIEEMHTQPLIWTAQLTRWSIKALAESLFICLPLASSSFFYYFSNRCWGSCAQLHPLSQTADRHHSHLAVSSPCSSCPVYQCADWDSESSPSDKEILKIYTCCA